MKPRRERQRDDRDYDTSQLNERFHAGVMGRDYSAHFFRWSFARRLILKDDDVLEVGCGQDKPLSKILVRGPVALVNTYTGVDLNPLKQSAIKKLTFKGEFNFVERYQELLDERDGEGFDILIHLEVIEHMHVDLGKKMLKACYRCLRPGGTMIMSTPAYDGKRHAANHIHEYTVPELQKYVEVAGFVVEDRFGTFMDIRHIGKAAPSIHDDDTNDPSEINEAVTIANRYLSKYYDTHALSCFFAPLYPDHARNNLWLCRRPD
jgi:2-polyprenyl-3-methyl-5-hydroxy-6-metoxy-1,4-benzoquinol methylase